MIARILILMSLLVLAIASPASAKGPDRAVVSVPGAEPLVFESEVDSPSIATKLASATGLFPVMFGPSDELRSERPAGHLGRAVTVEFRVPAGEEEALTIRQTLYPDAAGGPVTHTRAGQEGLSGPGYGGWYVTPRDEVSVIDQLRLPAAVQETSAADSGGSVPVAPIVGGALAVALVIAGAAALWVRRARQN